MAVTAADIRTKHPEFDIPRNTDVVLNAYIADAVLLHCAEVWGTRLDLGVEWKTCDLLARSPYGRELRLEKDETRTIYQAEWERIRDQVSHAFRLLP